MMELGPTTYSGNPYQGYPGSWEGYPTPLGETYPVTSKYGAWETFRKNMGLGPHRGIDIGCMTGTEIYAPAEWNTAVHRG